ncbi:hypothetical protein [Ramlibacter humi]|uniref:Uncharacterized protein n=1 Tax=Ramlibacter humi TaxID=2530451 RepID=A0A4Z0BY33_9BURK|nr:hypothetical protein [Ramlibacter humi]TFZ03592.1 hypothetical protein EZ216_07945 [Ramlibacter humi]
MACEPGGPVSVTPSPRADFRYYVHARPSRTDPPAATHQEAPAIVATVAAVRRDAGAGTRESFELLISY